MPKPKLDSVQIQKIVDSIDVKYKLELINHKIDNNLNIINSVNGFYDSAWNKLIFVIGVLGILLPIVIQYFQNKNLKLLLDEVNNKFQKSIKEIKEENKILLDEEIKKFEEKFSSIEENNIINELKVKWTTNLLHARTYFVDKKFPHALHGYFITLDTEIDNRHRFKKNNIRPLLVNILECLRNIDSDSKEQYEFFMKKLEEGSEVIFRKTLRKIEMLDDFLDYNNIKEEIDKEILRIDNI